MNILVFLNCIALHYRRLADALVQSDLHNFLHSILHCIHCYTAAIR
uniref:Uncharacterized protein n=1 Tax=Anguilla anguilla TaxID=7936 RepID=A0A0E9RZI1_ANGAN